MFILSLITKVDGVWKDYICVSGDMNKLNELSAIEREKKIQDNSFPNAEHLFKIGDLEEYVSMLLSQVNLLDKNYYINDHKIGNYRKLGNYIADKARPLAQSLGLDESMLHCVANQGFYPSLRLEITKIKEV